LRKELFIAYTRIIPTRIVIHVHELKQQDEGYRLRRMGVKLV